MNDVPNGVIEIRTLKEYKSHSKLTGDSPFYDVYYGGRTIKTKQLRQFLDGKWTEWSNV